MALECVHKLLGSLPVVPLINADVAVICCYDKVMHLVVDKQICDEVLFRGNRVTVERDSTPGVVVLRSSKLEVIEIQIRLVPAHKEALLDVQSHPFDPVAHFLELVETIVDKPP